MPKAYWVVTYRSIAKPEKMPDYAALALPAIQGAGGRFIVRGLPAATREKGLVERTVVAEFDSLEAACAAYDSPAYRNALTALGPDTAERDFRIVEAAA